MTSQKIIQFTIFLLGISWMSFIEASKFDFPKHLVGTNYSATEELRPYLIYNPVDLGDDILDDDAPLILRKYLSNATLSKDPSLNQYSLHEGHPRLMKAIAKMYSKLINVKLDPEENVLVTIGATEAVYVAFQGHTSPGDEWIVIEPAYSMYIPMIKQAMGVPRYTTLKPMKRSGKITSNDWKIDRKEMESLFSNKTKGILLNNPLNPLGKVYTYEELQFIASLAKKYDTLVVVDEAHEFITHKPHVRIASLPGMFERTITIGTASKSFSVAGWRVGWAYGPANILNHLKTVSSRAIDSVPTPQQEAIAIGFEEELRNLGKPNSYFSEHRRHVREMQEIIVKAFNEIGMVAVVPDGGYCILANWTSLKQIPVQQGDGSSMRFIKWLVKNIGVMGLPGSSYYSDEHAHLGEDHVRYCFHKKVDTVEKAAKRLQKLKSYQ